MTLPVSIPTLILIILGLAYSLLVSWLAFRQSGKAWMLWLPHWIGGRSGVSRRLRRHGIAAFGLLLLATIVFYIDINRSMPVRGHLSCHEIATHAWKIPEPNQAIAALRRPFRRP